MRTLRWEPSTALRAAPEFETGVYLQSSAGVKSVPGERGEKMQSKTRLLLALLVMIFASAVARAQVERAAARANRAL
jgi:hypothetical protein